MFVQSEKFIEAHGGRTDDVSIYGQESNPTTWRLVAMNLAIRGIGFNLGKEPADSFTQDQHPDLKADYVLANPPFNVRTGGAPSSKATSAGHSVRLHRGMQTMRGSSTSSGT